MKKRKTITQNEALELLYQAHDMVRGPLRTAIASAIAVAGLGNSVDLNNLVYDQLKPGQKLSDPKRPGLVMRHGRHNGRYWIFRTTGPLTRHQIEVPMGDYPAVGIAEARTLWRQLRDLRKSNTAFTESADGRTRPIPADRLLNVETVENAVKMSDLIEEYARKVKRSADLDARLLDRHIDKPLGSIPVASIEAKDLTIIIHQLHDRAPREAEKLRSCLSTMFRVAKGRTSKLKISEPWLPDDFADPMASVPHLPKRKVVAYKPTVEEMRNYYGNLDTLGNLNAGALLFQALTASRIGVAVDLSWSEIDLTAGRWVLPAARAKNATEHIVLLSTQALGILKRRRAADPDGAWVFPSSKYPDEHASSDVISKSIAANRSVLGVNERFVSHSVRHAATTWLAERLIPIEVRDRMLDHLPPSTHVDSAYNGAMVSEPARIAWQN